MISLILAILFSTLIIVTFRIIGSLRINDLQSIVFNYFFAVIYGLLIWKEPFKLSAYTSSSWFELSIIIGLVFIVTFFLLSRSSQQAGISITAVASRMSVMIPVIAGFVIFKDKVSAIKLVGIGLAIFSFYLIFKPKGEVKLHWRNIFLPFLLFLGIGTNDTMMKYIQFNYLTDDLTLFLTVVFFVAFIVGLFFMLYRIIIDRDPFSYKSILAGFVLGSFNFGSTYFFIQGMSYFESSLFFPVVNAGIVVLSSIIGLLFFKERLSRINWLGIGVATIAIMIITIA